MKLHKQHEPGDGEIVAALESLHGCFFHANVTMGGGDSKMPEERAARTASNSSIICPRSWRWLPYYSCHWGNKYIDMLAVL